MLKSNVKTMKLVVSKNTPFRTVNKVLPSKQFLKCSAKDFGGWLTLPERCGLHITVTPVGPFYRVDWSVNPGLGLSPVYHLLTKYGIWHQLRALSGEVWCAAYSSCT